MQSKVTINDPGRRPTMCAFSHLLVGTWFRHNGFIFLKIDYDHGFQPGTKSNLAFSLGLRVQPVNVTINVDGHVQ